MKKKQRRWNWLTWTSDGALASVLRITRIAYEVVHGERIKHCDLSSEHWMLGSLRLDWRDRFALFRFVQHVLAR